jgi:Domain of unknown function (DUF1851)
MNVVDEIRQSWGWVGLDPVEVVGENDFGNLMVKDATGKYWRICPEECTCSVVAANRQELDALSTNQEFLIDWHMRALVDLARESCGPLSEGQKYCLKIPSLFGGKYDGDNIATAPLVELVRFSGDVAKRTRDLPDGASVKLKVVD